MKRYERKFSEGLTGNRTLERLKKNLKRIDNIDNGLFAVVFSDNSTGQIDIHRHKIEVVDDRGYRDALIHDLRKANEQERISVEKISDFLYNK